MPRKVSKASVHYKLGTPAKHCGNCSMYRPSHSDVEHGICTLVVGPIEDDMVCDDWDAKKG